MYSGFDSNVGGINVLYVVICTHNVRNGFKRHWSFTRSAGEWDLLPVPPYKSRGKEESSMKTKEISLIAIIAALYAAMVIVLAPISFGPVQLRLADVLIPLAALFGLPVVYGVTLGALVANTYWFMSPIDIVLGALANLVAGYIIHRYKENLVPASAIASVVIGVIVGGYLWMFFPPPSILGLQLPAWLGMMISVSLSSLVAVAGLGVALVKLLQQSKYIEQLNT